MISPSDRMLFWVAIIVLPLGLLSAISPDAIAFSLAGCLVLAIVIVSDGWRGAHRLEGMAAELPEVVRMSKGREGAIEIHLLHKNVRLRQLKVGLPLPKEIHAVHEEQLIALPEQSERSVISWPCRPLRRGKFPLTEVCFETSSPLGFWLVRGRWRVTSEVRVYPNLLSERKHVAALFLNRGGFGIHARRQIGQGRDFEQLRDYLPGDSFDEIHWKATAKRGHPVTKLFQIERTQEIYVIIDASRLSARGENRSSDEERDAVGGTDSPPGNAEANDSPPESPSNALEHFINSALILALAAEKQGDLYGLATFSNQVDTFLRAQNGKTHYNACRDALYTLQARPVTPDYNELCAFLRLRLRRRALLLFLTNLDDPVLAENFIQGIELLRRQHLILVSMPRTGDVGPLFSNPNVNRVDDLYGQLVGHYRWNNLQELQKILQRRGVRFSLTPRETLSAELVSQYVQVKRRQLI